ncbi:MAG: aldehyde dehydrogenase family protein [Verrucomicrobiia bacterium]
MSTRVPVLKTYKLFIGGQFPRSESGRSYVLKDAKGRPLANVCRGSRKDFREAVVKARAALKDWSGRSGYNRAQILYRLAELVEGRRDQFVAELARQGSSLADARRQVDVTIDCLIYYAGWGDKYVQLFSTVNPVASPHFVFSVPEPTGVVALIAPEDSGLLGLVSAICPIITGGNSVIALASEKTPLSAITFSEVCAAGDVAGGVVNILTGFRSELLSHIAGHMDVNAIVYYGDDMEERKTIQSQASLNVKRVIFPDRATENPYLIMDTQEIKTTWHPVGY